MEFLRRFGYLAALVLLAVVHAPSARAETVLAGTTQMISGTQSYTVAFKAPGSGTISVELAAMPWSERVGTITSLSVVATSADQVLGNAAASEPLQFSVDGAGAFFAHISGVVQGGLQLGLFSVKISFMPSAVPLPASSWLLIAALALIFAAPALRRRKASALVAA